MRAVLFSLLVILVPASLMGCDRKSDKGGPGAQKVESRRDGVVEERVKTVDKAETFQVTVPAMSTSVNQGEKKEVEISISRGKEFHDSLNVQFAPPSGLKVDPKTATIKGDEKTVKVWVEAAKDAAPGDYSIPVTANPERGEPASVRMKVTVKGK